MATGPSNAVTAVNTKRKELRDYEQDYRLIHDCLAGQRIIKKGTTRYLPQPNAENSSEANKERYAAYLTRAVFYNVTQRTLSGLVGEVFTRDPVQEIPAGLDVIAKDADGTGVTLTQLSKRACRYTLSKGRAGVLTDYPVVEGGLTKADVDSGDVQPTITVYDAGNIINWRTKKIKAKTYLTLVVLVEKYDADDDGFVVHQKEQRRVLRLEDGVYTSELYREGKLYAGPSVPTDSSGTPFDQIPFMFIGSENNDAEIDHPPMLDLSQINVAHYRNSADYEEGVYMTGQPTPVFSGLSEAWVTNVMKGQVRLGSRGGVMLPEGGQATLLEMKGNGAAFEAMEHKERQMVALGAKLVEQKEVQRTATEANIENDSETSILSDVANNVSAAMKFALEMAARFTGDEQNIKYELNTDFSISHMSTGERSQLVAEWQGGAITFSEMREGLRKSGVATLDDKDAQKQMKKENTDKQEVDDPDTRDDTLN